MALKILFIGGTGNISTACTRRALALGNEVWHLNRGASINNVPDGVQTIIADINNFENVEKALKDHIFDVVVNFIAFNATDIERDFKLFSNKTRQYIFISSTSAYQKPLQYPVIREDTPLANPFWEYSRKKIEAEEKLLSLYRQSSFPVTIVRPSLTYEYVIPVPIGGWKDFNVVARIREGKPIVVHGDGSSLWTITHASDFAAGLCGLFAHQQAIGHAFHITSDEILTWDQIYTAVAEAVGCKPNIVHIASDFICESADMYKREPMWGTLVGDKSVSVIFDNSKIKAFVPEFKAVVPFKKGIAETIKWFEQEPSRCVVNEKTEGFIEFLLSRYKQKG